MTEEQRLKHERDMLIDKISKCRREMDEIANSGKSNIFKIMKLKNLRSKVQELEESYLEIYDFIQDNYEPTKESNHK